jgi:glycyl-tRNA synthetase
MVGLDSSILMNPKVWEASGHLDNFSDPMIDCKKCKNRFRADKLFEDNTGYSSFEEWYSEQKSGESKSKDLLLEKLLTSKNFPIEKKKEVLNILFKKNPPILEALDGAIDLFEIKCPDCKAKDWTKCRSFNLMFKTQQGVTDETSTDIYMRPETAQGIFVNFKNVVQTTRKKLPFGIGQIGKAFRNEITPGNFTFRTREFEQMEIEYFVEPGQEKKYFDMWKEELKRFFSFSVVSVVTFTPLLTEANFHK